MHITALVAAIVALGGGFVVLRWMPGRPRPAAEIGDAGVDSVAAELGIMEQSMLDTADREG